MSTTQIKRDSQLAEVLLGNLGARVNLRGYDGVEKETRGDATTAVGAALSSGNYGLIEQTTHGKHIAVPLAATAVTAAPTPANSVLLIDDAGPSIGAGKVLKLWNAAGTFGISMDGTPAAASDKTITLQNLTGTLALLGANVQNAGNLEFVTGTYDIGSNAHSPRDLTITRDAAIGRNLTVTGVATLTGQPRARAYNSGTISHGTSGAWQTVTFDSERYDVGACHEAVSHPSRLTAPSAGSYMIGGCIYFAGSAVGDRAVRITLNGTTQIVHNGFYPGNATGNLIAVSTAYDLAANDYVEIDAWQTSTAALNMLSSPNSAPEFWMYRYA